MTDTINRTTSIGLYSFGVAYLDTARAAVTSNARISFHAPVEFLCAHGLELIFKADLTRLRVLDDVRKQHGHDLSSLFAECSRELKHHFNMDQAFQEVVEYLAIGHSQLPFENRYLITGFRQVIEPAVMLTHFARLNPDNRQWLIQHFGGAI